MVQHGIRVDKGPEFKSCCHLYKGIVHGLGFNGKNENSLTRKGKGRRQDSNDIYVPSLIV